MAEVITGSGAAARRTAAPWVLGLYGLAGATFVVGAWMARWYGGAATPGFLFPLAAGLGGVAVFLAGMWAYAAHDTLATAMLGSWGAFWMAWGLLHAFTATGRLAAAGAASALGFWFIALAAITWVGALAAPTRHTALATVFVIQAAGATLAAIGNLAGSGVVDAIAGWVFVAASICAWYAGSAELLEVCYDREVLAVGRPTRETPRVVALLPHARRAS